MFALLLVVCVVTTQSGSALRCPSKCRTLIQSMRNRVKELEAADIVANQKVQALQDAFDAQELSSTPTTTMKGTTTQGPSDGTAGSGAVYIRWGRTVCPETSELVYEGFAGGTFSTTGGGSDYLCLPKDPEVGAVIDGVQGCGSYVYGAEFEVCSAQSGLYPTGRESFHDHDVPCAVCQATKRQTHLMIPAKISCPDGWVKEYQGLLMTAHKNQQRTQFACVDVSLGPSGGNGNYDGALFYVVEAICGSLPCGPYKEGDELSCVVCTK